MQRISKLTRITAFYLFATGLVVVFSGCPYSSVFKIDNEAQLNTDENYVGVWNGIVATGGNAPVKKAVKMEISKKTDQEYNFMFTGKFPELNKLNIAVKDTVRATAFMSTVDDRSFINMNIRGVNYIAEFMYQDNKISILPLNEHFTNKIIKTNDELRRAVMLHFKTRLYPYYDDEFCLRNMVKSN